VPPVGCKEKENGAGTGPDDRSMSRASVSGSPRSEAPRMKNDPADGAQSSVLTSPLRSWRIPRTVQRRKGIVIAALVIGAVWPVRAALIPTVVLVPNPAPHADAAFGTAVAGLDDVNGDGVPDLAVGAPGTDRVQILSGADAGVIRTISDPDGLTGKQFGFAVADVGDVNGDAIDDVAIGAPGVLGIIPLPCVNPPCPPDPALGRAFVISGATGAVIHKIVPADEFSNFGIAVAALGDVSGDGVRDIAVGMVPLGLSSSFGKVYAFSGASNAQLWMKEEPGGKQLPSFGLRLAGISDVNGDGRPDLLVGAHFHDINPDPAVSVNAGAAFVLSGATGAVLRTHTGASPANNDLFGVGLAGVGDQTGDGIADYAIGEAGRARVHLFSGATGAFVATISTPDTATDRFAFAIAAVGDQDGDGAADFWVGAPGSGKAHLLNWAGQVLATAADPAGGALPGGFGWSLSATGNLGGDAPDDLIVGKPAQADSAGVGSGAAFLVLLTANRPPDADAGPDQSVECTDHTATSIVLDGSGSTDPDGDALSYEWRDGTNAVVATTAVVTVSVPLGSEVFTLTVADGKGELDSDTVTVTVQDTTAPSLSVSLSPSVLWPPNHKLAPVAAQVTVTDACDPAPQVVLVSITSNESDNGLGDGETVDDVQDASLGTDDRAFQLRAERGGTGFDRVYTVTYRATDHSGNVATASAQVRVPHDQ
jgi:FG-GAP repeat